MVFMKYIRTEDKIYEVDMFSIHYLGETTFSCWDINHTKAFNNWHIVKQADTIEELCDEFVVIHKELNGNHTIHKFISYLTNEQKAGNQVYGAIWTDKGLIYVAKMNEKGELCLL